MKLRHESLRSDQFDSTGGRTLARLFTRLAASVARARSEYLATGADRVSSEYTPITVYRPFISLVMASVNRPDRISEAMFCCHSWVSASFAVMASPLQIEKKRPSLGYSNISETYTPIGPGGSAKLFFLPH